MKKAFSVFLSFCLCTITMLGFTACGDDEHEHEEDMPKAYQQEGLEVRFSGEAYSLEDGKIPPAILTEEFFCLHNYTITPVED